LTGGAAVALLAGGIGAALAAGAVASAGDARALLPAADRQVRGNTEYSGRFTFVRLRFDPEGFGGFGQAPWAHDYPRAETHLMQLVNEITLLAPRIDGSNILEMDDPELFKYPFAYVCEPGFWRPTDGQVESLRSWLLKGGFLIVDDVRAGDLYNFREQLARVLPGVELREMDVAHPIFHSFFEIGSLEFTAPTFRRYTPVFYGVFEENDPRKRLLAIVNYNNDIGDYWEFSDQGWLPVEVTNEAYKLGINYVVYAMTH
jgi:hypothetical protein